MKIISALLLAIFLGGCAHVAEIVDNQSIETDTINKKGHQMVSMTGDRRLIRTTLDGNDRLTICAETQADAMSARNQEGDLSVVGKGSLTDSINERLTVTYARTELSDVVRQLAWHLCNANLNGKLGDLAYQLALTDLQDQALRVLLWRANTDNTVALNALATKNEAEIIKANTEAQNLRKAAQDARDARIQKLIEDCKKLHEKDPEALKRCTL